MAALLFTGISSCSLLSWYTLQTIASTLILCKLTFLSSVSLMCTMHTTVQGSYITMQGQDNLSLLGTLHGSFAAINHDNLIVMLTLLSCTEVHILQ